MPPHNWVCKWAAKENCFKNTTKSKCECSLYGVQYVCACEREREREREKEMKIYIWKVICEKKNPSKICYGHYKLLST